MRVEQDRLRGDGRPRMFGRTSDEHRAEARRNRGSALHWISVGERDLALSQRAFADRCNAWARSLERIERADAARERERMGHPRFEDSVRLCVSRGTISPSVGRRLIAEAGA